MRSPRIACAALVALALWAVACHHAPPPQPPPPPAAPEPAPPPPPKCESEEEACTATVTTRARIPNTPMTLAPPSGWTYAQEATVTVAWSKGSALAVLASGADGSSPKAPPPADALSTLLERLDVRAAKKKAKIAWPKRKPDRVLDVKGLKIALFQLDGAERRGQKGPLLLFHTRLPEGGRWLVGAGFVPAADEDKADEAILAALESIGPEASGAP